METKSVWRVVGHHMDDGSENLFEAYFSDRDAAHEVYHRGEREYGLMAGYTKMRWSLEGFYLDDNPHIEDMFNDVREAMEE